MPATAPAAGEFGCLSLRADCPASHAIRLGGISPPSLGSSPSMGTHGGTGTPPPLTLPPKTPSPHYPTSPPPAAGHPSPGARGQPLKGAGAHVVASTAAAAGGEEEREEAGRGGGGATHGAGVRPPAHVIDHRRRARNRPHPLTWYPAGNLALLDTSRHYGWNGGYPPLPRPPSPHPSTSSTLATHGSDAQCRRPVGHSSTIQRAERPEAGGWEGLVKGAQGGTRAGGRRDGGCRCGALSGRRGLSVWHRG